MVVDGMSNGVTDWQKRSCYVSYFNPTNDGTLVV